MLLDLVLFFLGLLLSSDAAPASPTRIHVRFTSPGQAGFVYSQTEDRATVVPVVGKSGDPTLQFLPTSKPQLGYVGAVASSNDLEEIAYLSQAGLGDVAIITPKVPSNDFDTTFTYPSSFPEETSYFYFGDEVKPERKRPVASRRPVRPSSSRRRPAGGSRRRGGSIRRGGSRVRGESRRPSGSHRVGRTRGFSRVTDPGLVRNLVEPPTNPPVGFSHRKDDLVSNDLSQISFLLDSPPFFDSIDHEKPLLGLLERREQMGASSLLLGSIRPFFPFFRND